MRNTIVKKEQLKDLLQKYWAGKASEKEKRLIEDWYDHFDQEDIPDEIILKSQDTGPRDRVFNQITTSNSKSRRLLPVHWYWAAAVVLFMVVSYVLWQNQPVDSVQWAQKVTRLGQKSKFELSDGSMVYLNAGSQLIYPKQFSANNRMVKLKGEAFFEVTNNPEKPFIVQTDSIKTTVLGTSFNINTFVNNTIKVTVATGRVAVGKFDAGKSWTELTPNQQLTYLSNENEYSVEQVELADWISWKDGKLNLANRDLADVLPELERWYGVNIILKNQALGNCQFQTELHKQSLQSLLEEFAFAADIKYEIKQDTVFLQGTGCN